MKIKTLLIGLLVFTTALQGSENVRRVKFQDVLYAVARKAGYTPESGNFFTNQAVPVGEYINQWVDRLYTAEDWPEWTKVVRVAPGISGVAHVVPYESPATIDVVWKIGRVINVYLVDPDTTPTPVSTKFTLQDDGIHCGYEHGTSVWIEYLEPAPTFTAVRWRADESYMIDDVVYVPATGECYKSKTDKNLGHDPSIEVTDIPRSLPTVITQQHTPDSPGVTGQNQILRIYFGNVSPGPDPVNPPPNNSLFAVAIDDENGGTIAATSDNGNGSKSIATIMANIKTDLDADPDLSGYTITLNNATLTMDIEGPANFRMHDTGTVYYNPPPDNVVAHMFKVSQIQPYIASSAVQQGEAQELQLVLSNSDVLKGATYTLNFTDENGEKHSIFYDAQDTDGVNEVISGILAAISDEVATDEFLASVLVSVSGSTVTFRSPRSMSLNTLMTRTGTAFWTIVSFPAQLENPVIRGATADLLGEWGQTDKQDSQEGKVPGEETGARGDFEPTTAPLTTQQRAMSRYHW